MYGRSITDNAIEQTRVISHTHLEYDTALLVPEWVLGLGHSDHQAVLIMMLVGERNHPENIAEDGVHDVDTASQKPMLSLTNLSGHILLMKITILAVSQMLL